MEQKANRQSSVFLMQGGTAVDRSPQNIDTHIPAVELHSSLEKLSCYHHHHLVAWRRLLLAFGDRVAACKPETEILFCWKRTSRFVQIGIRAYKPELLFAWINF